MGNCATHDLLTAEIGALLRQSLADDTLVGRLMAIFGSTETRARRVLHVSGCPACTAAQRKAARVEMGMAAH